MEEDIVREVLESIGPADVEGDVPLPLEEGQVPVPLSRKNFHGIPDESFDSESVAFIDGGNAEILGAASFSLQIVRIAVITYQGRKRLSRGVREFYLLATFKEKDFTVRTFPESLGKLSFDSLDSSLRTGNQRILADRVARACRRLGELKAASECDSGIVVLDGDLHSHFSQEERFLKDLQKKQAHGISKTSTLMTKNGRVAAAALASMGQGEWHYAPLYRNGSVNVGFCRLHLQSRHVFRLDSFGRADKILSLLRALSSDPVFPGYPYPLLEADRAARVSNQEREYLRTKFMARFGDSWQQVKTYLRTRDAHDILDSVG